MSAVHAVIDLANAVPLRGELTRLGPDAGLCLFDPEHFPDLAPVGPWLVDLGVRPDLGEAFARAGPPARLGIRVAWNP